VAQGRLSGIIAPQSDLVTARTCTSASPRWGTFLVGRHDTPYKMSTGKLDLFADGARRLQQPDRLPGHPHQLGHRLCVASWSGLSFAAATVAPHLYDVNSDVDADSLNGAWSLR